MEGTQPTGSAGGPATGVRPPPAPPPRRRRGAGTVRDIVLSLGVVAVVLVGYLLVSGLYRNIVPGFGTPAVAPVDATASARAAAPVLPFAPLLPAATPTGWAAQGARVTAGPQWHATYRAVSGGIAALDQVPGALTAGPATSTLDGLLPDRQVAGTAQLASGDWRFFTADPTPEGRPRSGLVTTRGGSVVIVSGTADAAELRQLAAALVPVPGASAAPTG